MSSDWTLYAGIAVALLVVVFIFRVVRAKVEDATDLEHKPIPDDDRLPEYDRDGYILEDNQKIRVDHNLEADPQFYARLETLKAGDVVTLTVNMLVEAEELDEDLEAEFDEIKEEPIPTEEELAELEATHDPGDVEDLEDYIGPSEENEPEEDEALLEDEDEAETEGLGHESPGLETLPEAEPEGEEFVFENMAVQNLDVEVLEVEGDFAKGKLLADAENSESLKTGTELWFHKNHILLFGVE